METENIILKKQDHIAIITINHPAVNALSFKIIKDLEQAVDEVQKDKMVRVVIITGAGEKFFSAGFDLNDTDNVEEISPRGQALFKRIDRSSKPVIAAINGFAMGGGCELALSCHFRIMVDNPKAKIGLPELNLGIIPAWGGTQRLPRLIGRAKALEMIFFSKKVTAHEALEIGLVDKISTFSELMDDTLAMASGLAQRAPLAVRCFLNAFSAGEYEGIDQGLEVELEGGRIVRKTNDFKEGIVAFMEKRKPEFRGN